MQSSMIPSLLTEYCSIRPGYVQATQELLKLLAEEAGLECIVVTGYLDGELPHAWNKVKIDGEWQIVDSTNNDNEADLNALLNLSDTAADKVL